MLKMRPKNDIELNKKGENNLFVNLFSNVTLRNFVNFNILKTQ